MEIQDITVLSGGCIITHRSFSTFSENENRFLLVCFAMRKHTLMKFPSCEICDGSLVVVQLNIYDGVDS